MVVTVDNATFYAAPFLAWVAAGAPANIRDDVPGALVFPAGNPPPPPATYEFETPPGSLAPGTTYAYQVIGDLSDGGEDVGIVFFHTTTTSATGPPGVPSGVGVELELHFDTMPEEGQVYRFRVRATDNTGGARAGLDVPFLMVTETDNCQRNILFADRMYACQTDTQQVSITGEYYIDYAIPAGKQGLHILVMESASGAIIARVEDNLLIGHRTVAREEIIAHEAKVNPHPQYITETEGDARYSNISHTHDHANLTNVQPDQHHDPVSIAPGFEDALSIDADQRLSADGTVSQQDLDDHISTELDSAHPNGCIPESRVEFDPIDGHYHVDIEVEQNVATSHQSENTGQLNDLDAISASPTATLRSVRYGEGYAPDPPNSPLRLESPEFDSKSTSYTVAFVVHMGRPTSPGTLMNVLGADSRLNVLVDGRLEYIHNIDAGGQFTHATAVPNITIAPATYHFAVQRNDATKRIKVVMNGTVVVDAGYTGELSALPTSNRWVISRPGPPAFGNSFEVYEWRGWRNADVSTTDLINLTSDAIPNAKSGKVSNEDFIYFMEASGFVTNLGVKKRSSVAIGDRS